MFVWKDECCECAYNCGVVRSECLIYFMAEERTNERTIESEHGDEKQL